MPTLNEAAIAYNARTIGMVHAFRTEVLAKLNEFEKLLQVAGAKLGDTIVAGSDQGFGVAHSNANGKGDEIATLAADFRNLYDLAGTDVVNVL